MAFATINKSAEGYCIYYFNKSINQYYISGMIDGYFSFKGLYNNGAAAGQTYGYGDAINKVNCTADTVGVPHPNGAVEFSVFIAVIIYPAIYGDVTIS